MWHVMHYIIDGHNLIGQSRTIRLSDPEDEARLTDLLHRWLLRRTRTQITVVFDRGVYGHPQTLARTDLNVIFEHSPRDADTRILHLIAKAGSPAAVAVVTSDRRVGDAARQRGIRVIASASFAAELESPSPPARGRAHKRRPEPKLARSEVEQWLRLFGADEAAGD